MAGGLAPLLPSLSAVPSTSSGPLGLSPSHVEGDISESQHAHRKVPILDAERGRGLSHAHLL